MSKHSPLKIAHAVLLHDCACSGTIVSAVAVSDPPTPDKTPRKINFAHLLPLLFTTTPLFPV